MQCEWTVDEADGCTLRLQCTMKDACDSDECYDLEMLVNKAMQAPRYFTDSKLISGPHANFTEECTTKCGKICPSINPTYWTDYLPDTTPLVNDYMYPVYDGTAHVLYNYIFSPANNWVFTPTSDYVFTPIYDYILGPVWHFIIGILFTLYGYLPSSEFWMDMYTLEFLIHFLACVFSVSALVIVLFVYFCYVFTDKAKFGVVTRHPLKETVPKTASDDVCQPGCTKDHTHRRDLHKNYVGKPRPPESRNFLAAGVGSRDYEAERRFSAPIDRDRDRERDRSPRPFFGMGRRRRSSQDLHRKMTQIAQSFDRPRRISGSWDEEDEDDDHPSFRRSYRDDDFVEMDVDHMARNTCVMQ